ncbi:hypothetical protein [Paenibacillus sp. NRS-1760]|uniref:hypothetical protein n=1 Tax=Paenibacillus sp. NRS-1760 TaxID=3233902 RepID=UPI003D2C92C0
MKAREITCCKSCGWGSDSITISEVQQQVEKHGVYVCEKCEAKYEAILNHEGDFRIKNGFGSNEAFITEDSIYYVEADRGRIVDPKAPFLGFGGRWFLIVKRQDGSNNAFVTNSLFHWVSIPAVFRERFKKSDKVNSTIVGMEKEALANLRDILKNIPHLN